MSSHLIEMLTKSLRGFIANSYHLVGQRLSSKLETNPTKNNRPKECKFEPLALYLVHVSSTTTVIHLDSDDETISLPSQIVFLKNAVSTTQFDRLLLCCLLLFSIGACVSSNYMIVQHCFGGGGGGGTLRRGGRGGTGSMGISRILGFGLCFFLGFVCAVDTVLSSPALSVSPLRSACF